MKVVKQWQRLGLHPKKISYPSDRIAKVYCILNYCQMVKRLMLTSTVNLIIRMQQFKKNSQIWSFGKEFSFTTTIRNTLRTQKKLFKLGLGAFISSCILSIRLSFVSFFVKQFGKKKFRSEETIRKYLISFFDNKSNAFYDSNEEAFECYLKYWKLKKNWKIEILKKDHKKQ